jgi:hypothetical protein
MANPLLPASADDPTAGFTDMQWFMFRQQNIAFYAAFSSLDYDRATLVALARRLLEQAPQLAYVAGSASGSSLDGAILAKLVSVETVGDFAGFPEAFLNRPADATSDRTLPMFRIRVARLADAPNAAGRRAFLLVQVSHALVEGADSALLSRSQTAVHLESLSQNRTPPAIATAAHALGSGAALLHLLAGNLVNLRPGPFAFETRAYPRAQFSRLARELGVRQRSVFFALVMHTVFSAGTPGGKPRMSCTYSTIDAGGGAHRDPYMRMRMLLSRFRNAPDFPAFVRSVDAQLTLAEARESGFNAELNAAGLHFHRRFSQIVPWAYTPRVFGFMPYDIVIGLIPPHRLGGALTTGLFEPVYAGAATPGANACVIVPGRELVSFNFYLEQRLVPTVHRLDVLLENTFAGGINSLNAMELNGSIQGDNVAI